LRKILSDYLNTGPEKITFTYNQYGKPATNGIHFNLSHSADLAILAVSRTRELGVDLEKITPIDDRIAEHFFSPNEVAALRALPEDGQQEAFFAVWTRKEAYVKAHGQGLSIPLSSFDVSLDHPARFLRGVDGWSIESFEPAPGYVAALVAED